MRAYYSNEDWSGAWEDDEWTSYDNDARHVKISSYDGWYAWHPKHPTTIDGMMGGMT